MKACYKAVLNFGSEIGFLMKHAVTKFFYIHTRVHYLNFSNTGTENVFSISDQSSRRCLCWDHSRVDPASRRIQIWKVHQYDLTSVAH